MLSRYQILLEAFRACDIAAELRTVDTESGPQPELSGRIPTNIYVGTDSIRQFTFTAWFAGRGKWLCIESTPLHSLPQPAKPSEIASLRHATTCANKTGEWASLFHYMEGNTVIAGANTVAPACVPLEDLVRVLIDDLQQAIDTTHYLFALTVKDGVCTPALVDDTAWVEHSLALAIAAERRWENGGRTSSPTPGNDEGEDNEEDQDKEDDQEEDEIEIEMHSDFEELDEVDEDGDEDGSPMEDEDEGDDSPRSQSSGKPRPPWE